MTSLSEPVAGPDLTTRRNYFHSLAGTTRWWKLLVIIVTVVVGYLIVNSALTVLAFLIEAAVRRQPVLDVMSGSLGMTPLIFGSALLSLIALLPLSLVLHRLLFPDRPLGTLFSVAGRFRWRWAGQAVVLALIMIGGLSALVLAIAPDVLIIEPGAPANPLAWMLVALLLMPLQAAAEEITFRGLLGRGVAGLFARAGIGTVVGLAVSTVAFGSAHLAGDPWLIAYYSLFGLLMGVVAWRTGGIEASVALHVVNNVVMGVVGAVLDRSIESGIDRSAGAGSPLILVHLCTLVLTAVVLIITARRSGVAPRSGPAAERLEA